MLLGDPPRTQFDLNFSLLGIPVRVHPLFWLITLLLARNAPDAASVATWIFAVFLAILVHEMGHALTMRAYGFEPWITLYGLGGLASYNPAYTRNSKGSAPLGQILICAAGPGAGFLLAAVLLIGLMLAGYGHGIAWVGPGKLTIMPVIFAFPSERLADLFNNLFFICTMWGFVNLLPIYPLDGGQIAREIFTVLNPRDGIRQSLIVSMFAAAGMAVFGWVQWQSFFVAIFFGYLSFASYAAIEAYTGRRPW